MDFLLMALVMSAPVPVKPDKPKPAVVKKQPAHIGTWRMRWGEGEGDVIFYKDGGYWCMWLGQQWIGHWKMVDGRLVVTEGVMPERPDEVPANPLVWSVILGPTGLTGEAMHGETVLDFALRRHE